MLKGHGQRGIKTKGAEIKGHGQRGIGTMGQDQRGTRPKGQGQRGKAKGAGTKGPGQRGRAKGAGPKGQDQRGEALHKRHFILAALLYFLVVKMTKYLAPTDFKYVRQAFYFLTLPWVIRDKTDLG